MPKLAALPILLALLAGLVAAPAALHADETSVAMAQLTRQAALLDSLKQYVERRDLGRLVFVRGAVQQVSASITSVGLRHFQTSRQYQNLIVAFRFSRDYFKRIDCGATRPMIKELLSINDEIVRAMGFDDSPYTQITASVFTQMHKLVGSVLQMDIPPELRSELQALVPELGSAIAIASEGDRPRAFEVGTALYHRIAGLYPLFDTIMFNHAAFDSVMNIQGLNEFYGDYAQIPATR